MSDLANARAEIDRIDAEILQLFARRMAAGKTIGKVKAAKNLPICNPEREREIVLMRFGLDGRKELTQKEVAGKMGISQSYISRLEKRIMLRLKKEFLRQTTCA